MTKKTGCTLTLVVLISSCLVLPFGYAVDLQVSGEMKTGVIWDDLRQPVIGIHNNDDSGPSVGRLRLGMHFSMENFGVKVGFEQTGWDLDAPNTELDGLKDFIKWDYVYAYGSFLNDRLRISAGQLSDSPWRAGGPDIWQGLDHLIGIRTEIMPASIPGLNFGFTINDFNISPYYPDRQDLGALLLESVLGVSYSNRFFDGRFSWRLDSAVDVYNDAQEGHSLMYRLEPKILEELVPGLRVWANGWWRGIGPRDIEKGRGYLMPDGTPADTRVPDDQVVLRNWLYAEYTHPSFFTELRVGAVFTGVKSNLFQLRPSFYYRPLPVLRVGSALYYEYNFGEEATITDVPFRVLALEPEVRLQFGGSYIALVYRYEMQYDAAALLRENQWINLRLVVTF